MRGNPERGGASATMIVVNTPSQEFALTNFAFCSAGDFRKFATPGSSSALVLVGDSLVLSLIKHGNIPDGQIALNSIQRRHTKVSAGDQISVITFFPPSCFSLALLTLELDNVKAKANRNEELDAVVLAQHLRKKFVNQQNARVPQFGKWENDGSVPYTQYFENARKGKNATKLFNPNDPLQNPEAFQQEGSLIHTYPPSSQGSAKAKHERRKSREDADRNQASKYTSAEALPSHKLVSGSPNRRHDQGNLGHPPRKPNLSNVESDHSTDRSPVHPHLHYRSSSKGTISSPSRERRSSSDKHGLAPNTPGRTKMKPSDRNDYSVDKGSAVPKFGEWDVMDPASADSYSYIFNQVREQKHSGSTNIPSNSRESKSNGQKKRVNSESTDLCCFCFKK